ncbi:hypothetical protein N7468_010066 [Penicillium chermesinum]|uniref:non-specific serine/threonine protein kinase n=1 Tax=Penicillium chermesinum TaxID=63820 RepID=A0A9W9NDY0_9EURO|nr:uncharacterized protein N7468_010066 [Penicillium chermesinum]KAJ5217058.1 hypothetical protein N7468_010066 [Penicillium chermesinum]
MSILYPKQVRKRRSVFGLWIPTKIVTVTNKCDPSPPDSAISDSPASEPIINHRVRKDRFKVRLTRSGSKLLLFLGLGSSSNIDQVNPIYMADDIQRSEPLVTVPSVTVETQSCKAQINLQEENGNIGPKEIDQPVEEDNPRPFQKDDAQDACVAVSLDPQTFGPTLVNRLSQRISMTFGNPTVIRRAHLRSRPSIYFADPPTETRQGDGINDSSEPSSPSSHGSPQERSTQATPVTSIESNNSGDKDKDSTAACQVESEHISETPVSPSTASSNSPMITPSIVTVEAAAVAKVYLELYFDSIFQSVNPRVQRQHELEQHIYAFQLAPAEQAAVRSNWVLQENEHLRHCRALKTSMRSRKPKNAVSNAGYEVIKILGKGSFGVVRLVREKDTEKRPSQEELASTHEGSFTSAKFATFGMLRSAVDGTKSNRRRFMTAEKKEVYAMKVIKKSDMIRNSQEGHIRAERDFLVASESSRWVVPLITSFQDDKFLYLVMDYMVGGDFLGLLIRKDILREDWTRFYIAEMILCIEEAHRLHWIHRDVKPDNFLISASGHLKISDFGLAFNGHWSHDQIYYNTHRNTLLERLGINVQGDVEDQKAAGEADPEGATAFNVGSNGLLDYSRAQVPSTDLLDWRNNKERRRFAKSVVGTSQYMAPEVIRGEMYDGRCDWWSLGIILYEQHSRTLQFPREKPSDKLVSKEAIDLIHRILQEREIRLSCDKYQANDVLIGRPVSAHFLYSMDPRYRHITSYFVYPNDAVDIKAHPFFRGIRWNELHLSSPPLVPRVRNWEDTRYFDDWKSTGRWDEVSAGSESDNAEEEAGDDAGSPNITPESPEAYADADQISPLEPVAPKADAQKAQDAEKKDQKRARDKILRDKKVGRAALEIRKHGAFLGYTYRRPKGPALALGTERGRQPFGRGHLIDMYSP